MKHPARYSNKIVEAMGDIASRYGVRCLVDPFAGTGRIHELRPMVQTWGIEIEQEWASVVPQYTFCGNAFEMLPRFRCSVFTSPTYGNRFADHHKAKDASRRRSYTHDLGRKLSADNSGVMQWGEKYQAFHRRAWAIVREVARDRIFVLNIKDHYRGGRAAGVPEWHLNTCLSLGFTLLETITIPHAGMRYGANRQRVDAEYLFVFGGN